MEQKKYKKLDYVTYYPKEFDINKQYPLVIYLHGAGTRGRNVLLLSDYPIFQFVEKQHVEAIFVLPQCYGDSWFDIFEQLQDFVHHVMKAEYVNKSKVYLMGASMGGYATWQLAMTHPEWFAAIVPICGGGMYWNAGRLTKLGVWAFHGSDDSGVFCEESEKMVQRINEMGGNAKLTVLEGIGHDAWTSTFQNVEMWKWLLEQESVGYAIEDSIYNDVKKFG